MGRGNVPAMHLAGRLALLLGGATAAWLLLSKSAAHGYLQPVRSVPLLPPDYREEIIAGTPCWVTPGWRERKTVFLAIHGYGGGRNQWTLLAKSLDAEGFGVVMPAMPGHDASPERSVGFGQKEAGVVTKIAEELAPRRIVLLGVSLGGAAVWQAAGAHPERYAAVATEGTYPTFSEAMDRFLSRLPGPKFLKAPVVTFARWESGIDPALQRPIDGAREWAKTGKPAIVCHGDADELFPLDYGRRMSEAANCPLWIVPGARHAYVDETDHKGWVKRLVDLATP